MQFALDGGFQLTALVFYQVHRANDRAGSDAVFGETDANAIVVEML
jgi:hypothetical protein